MTPTVSVVIPLYNKGPHIERTLASIGAQSSGPLEVIVVDDGSTDGGYEKAQAFDMPGLRVLRRSPPGPAGSAARNLGTQEARGEWVALLDADDEWLPNHLADMLDTLARAPEAAKVAGIFTGLRSVFPDGHVEDDRLVAVGSLPDALDFEGLINLWLKLGTTPISSSSSMIRRSVLLEVGGFPAGRCARGEDKDTWLRVASRGLWLPTRRVSAVYHRDAVNMTTRQRFANQVPCILHSINGLLIGAPAGEQVLLRRLANLEIFQHALATTRVETLKESSWASFDRRLQPGRAAILSLLSMAPLSAAIRWVAGLFRRDGSTAG